MEERKKQAYTIGIGVFILLATMTIGEYFLGVYASAWWAPLLSIALLKAFFIVRDYMHIGRVFASAQSETEDTHVQR
jgi:hypothetical protein